MLPPWPHKSPRHQPRLPPGSVQGFSPALAILLCPSCAPSQVPRHVGQSEAGAGGSRALPRHVRRCTSLLLLGFSHTELLILACSALLFVQWPPRCPLQLPALKCGDPPAGVICLRRPATAGVERGGCMAVHGEASKGPVLGVKQGEGEWWPPASAGSPPPNSSRRPLVATCGQEWSHHLPRRCGTLHTSDPCLRDQCLAAPYASPLRYRQRLG